MQVGRSGAEWETAKQKTQRLEMENERLRHDLERSQVTEVIILFFFRVFCASFREINLWSIFYFFFIFMLFVVDFVLVCQKSDNFDAKSSCSKACIFWTLNCQDAQSAHAYVRLDS